MVVDAQNRFGQQRRDGKHLDFPVEFFLPRNRNRIGCDDFAHNRVFQPFQCRSNEHRVRDAHVSRVRACLRECLRLLMNAPTRGNLIVNDDRGFAFNLTYQLNEFYALSINAAAPLVHDGQRQPEDIGIFLGEFCASGIRRDDDTVFDLFLFEVVRQRRHGCQMIHGDIKERLNLWNVKIDGDDAVRAGSRQEISDKFRANRLAPCRLVVLPCVSEVGDDGGNLLRRCPLHRVNRDEQFHQVFISRFARWLDEIDVCPANAFFNLDSGFAIRKRAD